MPKPARGTRQDSVMGNRGGAVRGSARAAQVHARNAARKVARPKRGSR